MVRARDFLISLDQRRSCLSNATLLIMAADAISRRDEDGKLKRLIYDVLY